MTTTVSRVYDTYADAGATAVTAVEASGIPSSDVSLVTSKYVSEKYADVHEVSAPATGAGIGGVVGGRRGPTCRIGGFWPFPAWDRSSPRAGWQQRP